MKHVTFAHKSVFVGDEAADTLVRYAATLARHGTADAVRLTVIGADGHVVGAQLVLDGSALMAEDADSQLPEPDNSEAVAYMNERIAELDAPMTAGPLSADDMPDIDLDFDPRAPV